MEAWTIIYADLSTFDSSEGSPSESPGLGVLSIVVPYDLTNYTVMHGGGHADLAYFWWQDEQWYLGNYVGFVRYLQKPGVKVVRFGETVPNSTWAEMWPLIERKFGPKYSWLPGEQRRQTP
jgi:hypothetical protein